MADGPGKRAAAARAARPHGEDLAREVVRWGAEKKAISPAILDLRGRSPFTDYFVVLSGRSDRQVKAIVESVVTSIKQAGVPLLGVEGESRGQWVLIDAAEVVVHVFYAPVRGVYDLESLWADAPRISLPELPPDAPPEKTEA